MEITTIGEGKYQVIHDGRTDIMTLDEVVVLLSRPTTEKQINFQEQLEEFWNSRPIFPRM